MELLNLGCGYRYDKSWINVDFVSTGEGVIAYNLLQGIPFSNDFFDAVYHSHVLEHFPKKKALEFIQECFRVLKPNGTIRIAVPDLEQIVREYLTNLEGALLGKEHAILNYDWSMVELYDQTVRNYSGGEYGDFWWREHLPNHEYMIQRMGYEYLNVRNLYEESIKFQPPTEAPVQSVQEDTPATKTMMSVLRRFLQKETYTDKLKKVFFKEENERINQLEQQLHTLLTVENEYAALGRFRMSGEIHQWMYDRFSLKRLLEQAGFIEVLQTSAYESRIPNWAAYQLDTQDGKVRKPDSLFMEAIKV